MNNIRKAWIGPSLKDSSMSWEVGQSVYGGHKVHHFTENEDGSLYIYIGKGDLLKVWKKYNSSMPWGVEYDLESVDNKI